MSDTVVALKAELKEIGKREKVLLKAIKLLGGEVTVKARRPYKKREKKAEAAAKPARKPKNQQEQAAVPA